MLLSSAPSVPARVVPSFLLSVLLALGTACSAETGWEAQPAPASTTHRQQLSGAGFTFTTTTTWDTGYCAEMRVANTTGTALIHWKVTFDLIPGMTISSLWQGTWTSQGSLQTVTDQGWNGALEPGAEVMFGFCGNQAGTVNAPLHYTFTGQSAGGGGGPPPPPPADTQAPSVVTGLSVLGLASKSVDLAWQASTDNVSVTGYEVFLNNGSTPVATPTGTSVSLTGLTPGTSYTFTVKAKDAAGNRSAASAALTVTTPSPKKLVGYFIRWGVYDRAFYAKTIDANGTAAKLTHLNYAFGNVVNGRCGILASPLGDPFADYQMAFTASTSVDGQADGLLQPLKGNFNQLKKLKARYPNLKVLISLGGWDWSAGFSDAVSTPEKRQALAQSCIDLYIRGNVPGLPAGALAGVFDGIDVDWEFPGGSSVAPGRPEDTVNFTAALAELRRQLDLVRPGLVLSIASSSAPEQYSKIQLAQVQPYLDHINVMTYDMHGSWESTTNFHSALYNQSANPARARQDSTHEALMGYLAAGVAPGKLIMGVPFYGRGWRGTQAGPAGDGLYQNTAGPAWGNRDVSGPSGMFDYSYIRSTLEGSGVKRQHPEAQVPSLYNPSTGLWVSYDDPVSLGVKGDYILGHNLGGAAMWELSGDDAQGSLITALKNKLNP
jgi:chitinase